MKEMMNFEKFTKEVEEKIKTYLPDKFAEAEISLKKVKKNNGIELTGLNIFLKENPITPVIYLEQFFEKYEEGGEFEEILQEIVKLRTENQVSKTNFDVEKIMNFDDVKYNIFPKLVNYKDNLQLCTERPFKKIEDLAVFYYIDMIELDGAKGTIPITNELMYKWETDVSTIDAYASINLKDSKKTEFKSMSEVIFEMMGYVPEELNVEDEQMYILGFKDKINGAAAILDDFTMEKVVEKIGEDFYILPSSIHEVIIVPNRKYVNPIDLAEMVREVNTNEVARDERLSYNVYKYKRNFPGNIVIA